ncbi:MAG TPA: response regulator [Thermodesulfovibrionales bacterium]|nr:response regulator [Thermodesulfovibrionales bacterium]
MANILVVDNDYFIRTLLRELLTYDKHDVQVASDGLEVLETFSLTAPPDLIFMDHQMPRLSGIDCARQLKTRFPSLQIVLISGSFGVDDDGYLARNKYLFADILLKPFGIKDVVCTVEYALGGKARGGMQLFECCNVAQSR